MRTEDRSTEDNSNALISVQGLTRYFGSFPAVMSVDFSVCRGEIIGLIGPNGAGKSTILKMLTGIVAPTYGNGTIAGESLFTRSSGIRKQVGYLMENPPLYPEITVSAYLDICARLKGLDAMERQRQIKELMKSLALEEVSHRACGKLSKGFRQRTGIAQALLGEPDVLILDEPISGLDPVQIVELRELIRKLAVGKAVILSSHILSEVSQTCDRLLVLCEGRIIASGTPDELAREVQSGDDPLFLRISGPTDHIHLTLEKFEGVKDLELIPSSIGDWTDISVTLSSGTERGALSRAIVEAGLELLEIRSTGMSLEDIFVQLTLERHT